AAENSDNLSEEAFFLFWLLARLRGSFSGNCDRRLLPRTHRLAGSRRGWHSGRGGRRRWASQTENARQKSAMLAGHLVAGILGLGAGNKRDAVNVRARSSRQPVGDLVKTNVHHTFRLREILHVRVLRQFDRALHELAPDRRGCISAAETQVAIVVEAYPNDAEQVGGIARKPAIVRGASLPRRRCIEAHGAYRVGGAIVDHALHHAGHDVSDAGIKYRGLIGTEGFHRIAAGVA